MSSSSQHAHDERKEDILSSLVNKFVTKQLLIIGIVTAIVIAAGVVLNIVNYKWRKHTYEFTISQDTLVMKDGVALSVTYAFPEQRRLREKFPVVLRYSINRKDDTHYIDDYKYFGAFASSGYIVARVDVRGNGGSSGHVLDRMFSPQELDDGVEVIRQLSELTLSNGNVVMFGIAYNGLMLAARKPPALKTIYLLHGTDDLYYNNLNYIDGVFHQDGNILSVVHQTGLPKSPKYLLNEEYFYNRFQRSPWLMTHLANQLDNEFWKATSLSTDYSSIEIPIYLVAGLYDGYRDFALRIYEALKGKVPKIKIAIGPHNHDYTSYSKPGPNYDGKEDAVQWFNVWAKGASRDSILKQPDVTYYVRESYEPDVNRATVPGEWRYDEWPVNGKREKLYLTTKHTLDVLDASLVSQNHSLEYSATAGTEVGQWWGDMTGDMSSFDRYSLVYDHSISNQTIEIIGFPTVSLRVSANAPLANWNVRLEEVYPDGKSTLVTGGLLNGAFRNGRDQPEYLRKDEFYTIQIQMHFTTWKFQRGNKIRVSISNALFPLAWPTPYLMTTLLSVNDDNTWVELPISQSLAPVRTPSFTQVPPLEFYPFITKSLKRSDAVTYDVSASPRNYQVCTTNATSTIIRSSDVYSNIDGMFTATFSTESFETSAINPAQTKWFGQARTLYIFGAETLNSVTAAPNPLVGKCDLTGYDPNWIPGYIDTKQKRVLDLRTTMEITSDQNNFYCTIKRSIYENNALVNEQPFTATYPRQFH
jgi:putative CocE/NonD family hydrolase